MPYCTTCGYYFNGRGSHCSLHIPYLQDTYDTPIRYRTGRFRQPRKPRQIGYHDSYNGPDTDDSKLALTSRNFNVGQALRSDNLRPLLTTFNHLADTNSIASLTYNVSPAGDLSLTAHANLAREQCVVCLQYFPDRPHLDTHNWELPVGCEKHGVCLRWEDVEFHAMDERHSRCFVTSCRTRYRKEGGWRGSVVERHVREWHA
jgi:hypothetical protein